VTSSRLHHTIVIGSGPAGEEDRRGGGRSSQGFEAVKESTQLTQSRQDAKTRKAEVPSFFAAFACFAPLRETGSCVHRLIHKFFRPGLLSSAPSGATATDISNHWGRGLVALPGQS